ncbi:MAG: integration host factor subunit alpha [Thiotrichales bacterium]|nr:integration host factor subunit alpha [Thiotrichales bacterium]
MTANTESVNADEGFTLTKAHIAQQLSDTFGFNKRESKELVEQFYEEISDILSSGEQIKLSGFGNFELRDKSSRPGRNPRTGEDVPISARRVVTFKPGQKLRAQIDTFNGGN